MKNYRHLVEEFAGSGAGGFIRHVDQEAGRVPISRNGAVAFILRVAETCAYIRLQDLGRPLRFLRQMASVPPVQFGTDGFADTLVDDRNPARHYMAFVFVGFWLPMLPGIVVLYLWEIAGFIRYRGEWSPGDIRSGIVGLRHGRLVQRYGPTVLPALIAAEVARPPTTTGPVLQDPAERPV